MQGHRRLFSMLSALIDYPDQPLLDALPEIRGELADQHTALAPGARADLLDLLDWLAGRPLMDLQEDYVETFDRGRATSLYLFEHVHGESRDRGQAMIDLLSMYEAKGLFLQPGELPDYLPVFLEFLAREEPGQARSLLAEIAPISRQIASKLAERGTAYFAVVAALLPLAGEPPLAGVARGSLSPDPAVAVDGAELDREWQDQAVSFLGAQAPVSARPQPVRFYGRRPPP